MLADGVPLVVCVSCVKPNEDACVLSPGVLKFAGQPCAFVAEGEVVEGLLGFVAALWSCFGLRNGDA